jgi:hypothetical protein
MSELGSQPREVWKQPGRLPAEGRLGCSESTSNCLFLLPAPALFAYVPLVWHSEPSNLILNSVVKSIAHTPRELSRTASREVSASE